MKKRYGKNGNKLGARKRAGDDLAASAPTAATPSPPQQDKHVLVSEAFSGPIPPPAVLKEYDVICPGAADRILAQAEQQVEHRQALERMSLEAQIVDAKASRLERRFGQILGALVAIAGMGFGATVMVLGGSVGAIIGGTLMGGAPLAGVVTAFIYGHKVDARSAAK